MYDHICTITFYIYLGQRSYLGYHINFKTQLYKILV